MSTKREDVPYIFALSFKDISLPGINKKYSETVVPRVAKAVCEQFEVDTNTIMEMFGVTFVNFVGQYNNDFSFLFPLISYLFELGRPLE